MIATATTETSTEFMSAVPSFARSHASEKFVQTASVGSPNGR